MKRNHSQKRDQDLTPFAALLHQLCQNTGAHAAALVDGEGETVDYGGTGAPFDIRILAAELRLLQQHMAGTVHLTETTELVIRARRKTFHLASLPEGYALVLELPRRATGASERALAVAVRGICEEAGFDVPDVEGARWRSIDVTEEEGASRRPAQIAGEGEPLSLVVLGRLAEQSTRREQGYRVRLSSGQEGNLVREPLGRWYIEEG